MAETQCTIGRLLPSDDALGSRITLDWSIAAEMLCQEEKTVNELLRSEDDKETMVKHGEERIGTSLGIWAHARCAIRLPKRSSDRPLVPIMRINGSEHGGCNAV